MGRAAVQEDQAAVTLTHDFEIQQTEVTLKQWAQAELASAPNLAFGLTGSGPCTDPECPVNAATWYQALQHANWLSERSELESCYRVYDCDELSPGFCTVELTTATVYDCKGYRLPTTAEWEYASRAGTTSAFYSGPISSFERNDWCNWDPNLVRVAWYCANVPTLQEQPVAHLERNAWGLYDMLGNVHEWASDRSRGVPMAHPSTDPGASLEIGGGMVTQNCRASDPHDYCRATARLEGRPDKPDAGFRLVRTLGKGTLPTLDDVAPEYRNGWDTTE